MEIFSRTFDSTLQSIDAADTVATEFARRAGLSTKAGARIGLAVREIVANAVIHGNRYDVSRKVFLEARRSETQMVIVVSDEGDGFDPNRVADPLSPEGLFRSSGRGLLLARTLMDELHVGAGDVNGTSITLVKYIRWSAAEPTKSAPYEASRPR
jgi:serine/threonine-protein kinase RsbW